MLELKEISAVMSKLHSFAGKEANALISEEICLLSDSLSEAN